MASVKAVVRKGIVNTDGKANIKIRLGHRHKVTYLATPYYIKPKFMTSSGLVSPSTMERLSLMVPSWRSCSGITISSLNKRMRSGTWISRT